MAALDTAAGAELDAAAADELDAVTDAAGGGGGRSSSSECASFSCARATVRGLKLCDTKVWTLAIASWIEICEFKVNKIIVIRHTSERRLYMFVATVSRSTLPGDLSSRFTRSRIRP